MAIEGPLRELGIHDVFQLLDLSRKTGVLNIASKLRHNQGTVYFDGGAVVYAVIRSNPHPLGGMLVRAGKIGEADLQRGRDMQASGDRRRLGEILVAIGCLSERELDRQVRRQIEEVIFEVMNWREGYFSFAEGPLEEIPAEATVRIRTESLLMEGARRIDEWSRIEHKIPNVGVVPRLAPGAGDDAPALDFLPKEWEVLAVIDGELSVRGIAQFLGQSEFDVAKILFGLESAGIVVLGESTTAAVEADADDGESGDLAHLLKRMDAALALGDAAGARVSLDLARARYPQDPHVFVAAGRLAAAERNLGDAEDQFRRALRLDPGVAEAHRRLGDVVAMQGRLDEAVEWWRRWLKVGGQEEAGVSAGVERAVEAAETLRAYLEERHGE